MPISSLAAGTWALWNLILSIAGAILVFMIGVRVLMKRRRENGDEEHDKDKADEDERDRRSRLPLIVAIPILAVIAMVIFILTQDLTLKMIMSDRWTLLHAVIFAGEVLSYIFAYRRDKDEEDNNGKLASKAA